MPYFKFVFLDESVVVMINFIQNSPLKKHVNQNEQWLAALFMLKRVALGQNKLLNGPDFTQQVKGFVQIPTLAVLAT